MPSRLERQAEMTLRVREGSEGAVVLALLDNQAVNTAADALGVTATDLSEIRKILMETDRVVVIFGDELRGAALEALPLIEKTLATPSAEVADAAKKAHLDMLARQVRSTNSTNKPAINENPFTSIVAHPTLEIAAEPAQTATKFSFVPLVRYANSLGAYQMGMDCSLSGGLSAQSMIQSCGEQIKALYIAGENVIAKTDEKTKARLTKLDLLIVQDMFLTETAAQAHIVFPTTSFAESQGTQVNNGGQAQLVRRTIPPVGQARPDWMITSALARLMGHDFGFQNQVKFIFKEICEHIEGYVGLSHNRLANEGAIQIQRNRPEINQINMNEMLKRIIDEIARIDRHISVDHSELAAKAGSRLHRRYPLITRYSEMLSPVRIEKHEIVNTPVIFPE